MNVTAITDKILDQRKPENNTSLANWDDSVDMRSIADGFRNRVLVQKGYKPEEIDVKFEVTLTATGLITLAVLVLVDYKYVTCLGDKRDILKVSLTQVVDRDQFQKDWLLNIESEKNWKELVTTDDIPVLEELVKSL
tara:strand:- start:5012 stop:5422 length:411 start_codon:yes stop_codon:yes gene_type:complete